MKTVDADMALRNNDISNPERSKWLTMSGIEAWVNRSVSEITKQSSMMIWFLVRFTAFPFDYVRRWVFQ
ncbi:MAG: hypothetical protein EOO88_39825 [Pedobacter sp.]|nr:MAG: hypothetical protein EOO88_39825 [Pedobacter sp.]